MLPGHVTVEEGHFGVHAGWPEGIAPGDLVLLYCTGGYARYPKSVPGVGVVEEVDHEQPVLHLRLRGALAADTARGAAVRV